MRNIFLLSLIIILLLVISGCTTFPLTQPSKDTIKEVSPTQPGRLTNRGVTLNFIEGKPPQDRIRLGIPFRVKIVLQNWALEPVSGNVYLSDTPSGDLEAIQGRLSNGFSITGAEQEIKPLRPKEQEIDFGEFTYTNTKLTSTAIRAELEYDYNAEFGTQICVKSETATVSEQECTSRRTFTSNDLGFNAQHAPVTVTNIKQEIDAVGSQAFVTLTLTFQDFGGSDGWINNEDRSLDISSAIDLAGKGTFRCNPSILKFTDKIKTREVICRLSTSLPETNYFQNPLTIRLTYPYKTIIATSQIPIKPLEPEFQDIG